MKCELRQLLKTTILLIALLEAYMLIFHRLHTYHILELPLQEFLWVSISFFVLSLILFIWLANNKCDALSD